MRTQEGLKHVMLSKLLIKFVNTKVFSDVTLAIDDGMKIRAHKFFPFTNFQSLPKLNALTSPTSTFIVANMRTKAFRQLTLLSFDPKIKSKSSVRIQGNIENKSCLTT